VADEIADELEAEADALVVMATRARPHTAPVVGSVAEEILAYTNGPVLLMGPHSEAGDRWPTGPMIVCTDGSSTAEAIISAAGRWSSGLELPLSVVTVTRLEDAGRLHGSETSALEVVSRMAAKLADTTEQQVTEEVLFHRDPAAAIVDYARATHAALIAMATHGATGLRRIAMGSVAMGVVHQAPCPVLITQP
jgi:nucleotide-binding universal stress UspA family protein